jgi:hypothetical protein
MRLSLSGTDQPVSMPVMDGLTAVRESRKFVAHYRLIRRLLVADAVLHPRHAIIAVLATSRAWSSSASTFFRKCSVCGNSACF